VEQKQTQGYVLWSVPGGGTWGAKLLSVIAGLYCDCGSDVDVVAMVMMLMWLLCQLESICTSDSGTVSSSDALNLTDQVDRQKRLSKAEAEKFFTRLEREKWLMVNSCLEPLVCVNAN